MGRRYDDDDDDFDDDDIDIARRRRKRRLGGRTDALSRLQGPAIGLMVVIGLHLVLLCIAVPLNILALAGHGMAAAQGQFNFGGGPGVDLVSNFIGFLVQGFTLFGAIQMYRGEMYGVCMAACILACIPCFCSSCCVLGMPFGIWGLITLMDDSVKESFPS